MLILLTALYFFAFVMSLAIYLSRAVGGSEALNATRFVRTAAWMLAVICSVDWMLEGHTAIHSPIALVAGMLAFSEIVSGLLRFTNLVEQEGAQTRLLRPNK